MRTIRASRIPEAMITIGSHTRTKRCTGVCGRRVLAGRFGRLGAHTVTGEWSRSRVLATSTSRSGASPGAARPTEAASIPRTCSGDSPSATRSRERDRAVALGEPLAAGAEQQRHVRVAGPLEAEPALEPQLPRRGVEQVGAADDLADALVGVVDHHGEVVRERAVVAADHEVVDDAFDRPAEAVDHALDGAARRGRAARAAGRTPRAARSRAAVRSRQVPGYAPSGRCSCGADGASRISARVHQQR